jgi:hypothetical protein
MPMYVICYQINAKKLDVDGQKKNLAEEIFETDTIIEVRGAEYNHLYSILDDMGGRRMLTSTYKMEHNGNAQTLTDEIVDKLDDDIKRRIIIFTAQIGDDVGDYNL